MKKSGILLVVILFTGIFIQAQTIYFRGGGGAAVSTAARITADQTSENTVDYKKSGIGSGIPIVLSAGYQLGDYIGLELGVDYFSGFRVKSDYNYIIFSSVHPFENTRVTGDYKLNGRMLSLVPAVVLTYPFKKMATYARLGVKIGFLNELTTEEHQTEEATSYSAAVDREMKTRDYGGVAVGVQAALGAEFRMSRAVSFFGEIQVDGITCSPVSGKYTEYIENGADRLGTMDTRSKSWDYKKKIDGTASGSTGEPGQRLRISSPFGNVGVIAGIKYTIHQQAPSSLSTDTINYAGSPGIQKTAANRNERHQADLGIGFGLDYGGLLGLKIAYLPIPYFSVFAAGGYYLFGFGWNTGVTIHILPSTSRYAVRPNIKIMYGVNGGTMVVGASAYNKVFYGFAPGAGLEFRFGPHKKNGLDLDINYPIHGPDFQEQIDKINRETTAHVKQPLPVTFSIGFHHAF
ncbi:MAG: hypothetical protein WCK34_03530 [Bacteroidota bacterium]